MAFALPELSNEALAEFETGKTSAKIKSLTTTKVGDMILAGIFITGTGRTLTATGWTQIGATTTQGSAQVAYFFRIATEAGAKEYPITISTSSEFLWAVTRISKVNPTTPIVGSVLKGGASSTTIKWETVTPTEVRCMDVLFDVAGEAEKFSAIAGFTQFVGSSSTAGIPALYGREYLTKTATGETSTTQSPTFAYVTARIMVLGEEEKTSKTVEFKAGISSTSTIAAKLTRTRLFKAAISSASTFTAKLTSIRLFKAGISSTSTLNAKLEKIAGFKTVEFKANITSSSAITANFETVSESHFGIIIPSTGNSKWTFVLTDMNGIAIGEFTDIYERKYIANLSKPSTGSFVIRRDNPMLGYLFAEDEDMLLQIYQDETLRMFGPIVTSNFTMNENQPPTVAVTASDVSWRLGNRKYFGSFANIALSGDKAFMAEQVIAAVNAVGKTGIVLTGTELSGSTGAYTLEPWKSSLVAIQELGQGLDGFDWYIEPIKPEASGTNFLPNIGKFQAAAVVGSEKPSVTFEYGTGRRNIRAMNYLRDQSTRANVDINISAEGTEATPVNPTPVIIKHDPTNWERYGRYEDLVELAGVNNVSLREQYTQEALNIRKNPRRILSMTSDINDGTGRVPQFGTDYWLGDTVIARAMVNNFQLFDGLVRVYSVEVNINNAGTATYIPILIQEE